MFELISTICEPARLLWCLWARESAIMCAFIQHMCQRISQQIGGECVWPNSSLVSLHTAVFAFSSWCSIANNEDGQERELLVLIYPRGSLGITINPQLCAAQYRPAQTLPICPYQRGWSVCVCSQRGRLEPNAAEPAAADLRTVAQWWSPTNRALKRHVRSSQNGQIM